jgi:hypothetical protein
MPESPEAGLSNECRIFLQVPVIPLSGRTLLISQLSQQKLQHLVQYIHEEEAQNVFEATKLQSKFKM